MRRYKCLCSFVPPYVVDELAKAGVRNARMTIQQSEEFREARRLSTAQKATISQMLKLQKAAEVMPRARRSGTCTTAAISGS